MISLRGNIGLLTRRRHAVITLHSALELCGVTRYKSSLPNSALTARTAEALYSMEHYHKQCLNEDERRQVEVQAWEELMNLPDAAVEDASSSVVADILGSWCYFSKFWDRGIQGPNPSDSPEENNVKKVNVPLIAREFHRPHSPSTVDTAPPPRANPLDEVLDF
ncbi:uncharacterized protein TEOVI_000675000 [Trypanosoma equiperdum]|uniref:RNA-editing substrate-binding complex 7 protein domain-containing protein n=2 Tax=Trypanozoon TaxID=39700 RepID=Q584X9_TRYB2|nr:hypothetical protein, conserved [Trypanosoma brucei brucei TREU927]AAX79943.1 hypothetical protein, conserved [Trypanosoma brucei]AAZ11898.1 hypothetical protein, conserved [Trypanosoma brucei brucei TREU927]SCU67629.1 hypothetical protein, conserved [Trypanosoma equiperdum]